MVLECPDPTNERRTDGGNVQLMEARVMELFSSLRALYRSNQELTEALKSDPIDSDFAEALEENWVTIRGQRELATEIVRDMKARGSNVDMPQDICDMEIPAWKERKEEEKEQTSGTEEGVYL